MRITVILIMIQFVWMSITLPVHAEDESNFSIPVLSESPKIDGKVDNDLWEREALRIDEFLQFVPKEKGIPTEKTVAYIGMDEKNLYIAFRCFDSQPQKIRAAITNRDNIIDDDWVLVSLDTFNEKRRAFWFFLNPIGVQMDGIRIEEGGSDNLDGSWDAVFYAEGEIDSDGYTVELSIPFKSLRFPDERNKKWGLILGRTIARTGEIIIWPPASKDIPGLLTQQSIISIDGEVEKGRNFELMPVVTSLKKKEKSADFQPGLNFKWGINSDMTLDMTVNPDFSQIEADAPQIDVNQRFALYYPEKRPFFLEGMEIFRFPEIEMVYTRRIIDPLAGVKLTGKTGRFTYGLLSAYDTSPTESLWDIHNGEGYGIDNALFNIFRVKADVFSESYIGFCLADKEMDGSYNRVAGLDGQLKFNQKYFFSFQALGSKTKYREEESEFAPAVYADFNYFSKHVGAGLYWMSLHPDFEASSGFANRVDYKTVGAYSFFRLLPEKKNLNQIDFRLQAGRRYDYFGSNIQDEWLRTQVNFRLSEFSQLNLSYQRSMEQYSGIDFNKNSFGISGQFMMIKWLSPLGFQFQTGNSIYYDTEDPFLGYSNVYGLFMNFKPSKRLQMGTSFSKQTFWDKWGGELLFDYNVIRQRFTYQFTKELSLRTIVDYNHFYKKLYGSFLFSYILRPGTVFFLGLDNNLIRDEAGIYVQDDYSIFIKFSYWWRI